MLSTITKLASSFLLLIPVASAVCPYANSGSSHLERRDEHRLPGDDGFLDQFYVDDTDVYTTTDFGTPVSDRTSLKAGERGPTLLEDFVLRTKLTRFDHERVPERAGSLFPFLYPLLENPHPPGLLLISPALGI